MGASDKTQENPPGFKQAVATNQAIDAPATPARPSSSKDRELLVQVVLVLFGAYVAKVTEELGWWGSTLFFVVAVITLVAYRTFSIGRKRQVRSMKQFFEVVGGRIKELWESILRNISKLLIILVVFIVALFYAPPVAQTVRRLVDGPPIYNLSSAFKPSEYMGDVGDIISVGDRPDFSTFTYTTNSAGPCISDFSNGKDANIRCRFAGVMYLSSLGDAPGVDLTRYRNRLVFEARLNPGSTDTTANVEFVIGGATWHWDDQGQRVGVAYPDSMPQRRLAIEKLELNNDWQTFEYSFKDFKESDFTNVVAGFGWVISWGANDIQLNATGTGPEQVKTFVIEIRNIRYEG